jgi:hypothetical protein
LNVVKRIAAWLWNGCVALSLAVFVSSVVMWWVSCAWRAQSLEYRRPPQSLQLKSLEGDLSILALHETDFYNAPLSGKLLAVPPRLRIVSEGGAFIYHSVRERLGLASFSVHYYPLRVIWFTDLRFSSIGGGWEIHLPYWLIALTAAALPGVWMARFLRERRLWLRGRCGTCGYDLRATPDRCPECGTIPPRHEVLSS